MTINSVEIRDEDYYYYFFSTYDDASKDTGDEYEIKVEVHGEWVLSAYSHIIQISDWLSAGLSFKDLIFGWFKRDR